MGRLFAALIASSLWLCTAGQVHAQEETERYIPIGQSPGLSGTQTDIGEVRAFDTGARRLELVVEGRVRRVSLDDRTRIWLDRSKQQLTNLDGKPSDLEVGRTVEVRYDDPQRRNIADWIKIEVAG